MAGQNWTVAAEGGFMYADNLSEYLRLSVQPTVKFRQFADVKDASQGGLHRGATFHWDVYGDVATQGTTLVETTTMPETGFTITQGTLTMVEEGNSVPYTGLLDSFAEHPVREIIRKVLRHDAKKAFDIEVKNQFNTTLLRVVSTTDTGEVQLTTDGTATDTNSVNFQKEHVRTIVDLMKERNIPAFSGDDYYALARPSEFRVFKNDLEDIKQNISEGFQEIKNGEIGRYEGCRFVEQTHILDADWGTPAATWAAVATASGGPIVFFGEDTVAEAIAVPEEIRGKLPGDYGRDRGIAWYYLGGFGLTHTAAAQTRIVMWDSAA